MQFQEHRSKVMIFEKGVPQGAVLSPHLFNLLMDKLLSIEPEPGVTVLSYANNIAIVSITKDLVKSAKQCLHKLEGDCN